MKKILKTMFPIIRLFDDPIFCRHTMEFWDMKFVVEDQTSHMYNKFNNKVFKDVFCQCTKCGIQKKKGMKVGEWGKWKNYNFTPTKNGVISVEVYEFGKEPIRIKRDRILKGLGI